MVCGNDLGKLAQRCCLDNSQIKDCRVHNWIVDGARGLKGTHPSFLVCKGDGWRIVLSWTCQTSHWNFILRPWYLSGLPERDVVWIYQFTVVLFLTDWKVLVESLAKD